MKYLLRIAALSAVLLPMPAAIAHGVTLVYQPQQVVKVTARYETGEPMANATVQVFAPHQPEKAAFQSTTNSQGEFQFTPDQPGNWQVQVRQAGHGGQLTVPVNPVNSVNIDTTEATLPELAMTATPASVSLSHYTPAQISIMVLAILWGAIGTACFAWSRRRVQVE